MSDTRLLLLTDGGENWIRVQHSGTGNLHDLYFHPSGAGWAVGDGTMLKTTNRGAEWQTLSPPTTSSLWAVDAIDRNNLYVTADGGRLFITRNGGLSWTERSTNSPARLTHITVDDSGRNITLGWERGLFVSTGAGVLWEERRAPTGALLEDFSFLSPKEGWAGQENGPMLSTTDAGLTWQEHEYGFRQTPGGLTLMSIVEMIRPGFGYLAGNPGYILQYSEERETGALVAEGKTTSQPPSLWVRQEQDHLVIENLTGWGDVLVYDALGQRLAEYEEGETFHGRVRTQTEGLGIGHVLIVEEGSGRTGQHIIVE